MASKILCADWGKADAAASSARRGADEISPCVLNAKPEINYPCEWSYQLIGRGEEEICEAVLNALGSKKHTIARSRRSSKGNFVSMRLTLIVENEDERLSFFNALRSHSAILHIL
jgi:putative lipoic acid-binding regulatory protein